MKNKLQSLHKVLIGFLAIAVLVINTACSSADVTATKPEDANTIDRQPAGQITERYKPIAPAEGGMNIYSDTDPRRNSTDANAKADRNIMKSTGQKGGVNPLREAKKELDKKGPKERAEELSADVNRAAQKKADQVSRGTQRGLDNIEGNTKSFQKDVGSTADNLAKKASDKAENLGQKVSNKADEVADDVKAAAQKTADSVANRANRG
jgi:hypothetical protein